MDVLSLILALVALILAVVALFVGGILSGTPRVTFPNVSLTIDRIDINNCVGDFSGTNSITVVYPFRPLDARDSVEVKISGFVLDNVRLSLGTDTFKFINNDRKSFVFTGKLIDPCSDGTVQFIGTVNGTRLSTGVSSDPVTVSRPGFTISQDFPAEATLIDELNFDFTFSVTCCFSLPGVNFRIVTSDEDNVTINMITNGLFPCPAPGTSAEVIIKGVKNNPLRSGIFRISVVNTTSGVTVCRVGAVQVE